MGQVITWAGFQSSLCTLCLHQAPKYDKHPSPSSDLSSYTKKWIFLNLHCFFMSKALNGQLHARPLLIDLPKVYSRARVCLGASSLSKKRWTNVVLPTPLLPVSHSCWRSVTFCHLTQSTVWLFLTYEYQGGFLLLVSWIILIKESLIVDGHGKVPDPHIRGHSL